MYLNQQNLIDAKEITWDFIRSSGPGGQNVNKVATAVQLRFKIDEAASLPEAVKERLKHIAANKINKHGELIIEARQHRSQLKNREEAIERLMDLIQQARIKPRIRKHTCPGPAARRRRLESKRRHSEKKKARRMPKTTEW